MFGPSLFFSQFSVVRHTQISCSFQKKSYEERNDTTSKHYYLNLKYRHTDQHAVLVVHLFFNLSFLRCGLVDSVTSSCRLKALQMLRWDTGLLTCRLCFHFFFLPTDLFFLFLLTNPKQGSAFVSTRERNGWPCMSTVSFDLWFIVFFLFFSCLVCGEGEGRVGFFAPIAYYCYRVGRRTFLSR